MRPCQTPRMASPDTVRKLQNYIYKRPQGQDGADVIARLEKEHAKDPLTEADWTSLIGAACSHPDAALVRVLAERAQPSEEQVGELMVSVVGSREARLGWVERRIAVLDVLGDFIDEGSTEQLSKALFTACWFGDSGSAAWLIEHGADIRHTSWNAIREADVDCLTNAEIYGERTGDFALRDYLQPWYDDKTPLGDWRALYDSAS